MGQRDRPRTTPSDSKMSSSKFCLPFFLEVKIFGRMDYVQNITPKTKTIIKRCTFELLMTAIQEKEKKKKVD